MFDRRSPTPAPFGVGGLPLVRWAAALLLGLLVVLVPATPAHAHAQLVGTTPANGARLDRAPAEVVLRFSERVNPVRGGIRLLDSRGTAVALAGPARVDPAAPADVRQPLPALGDGAYTVVWRVVSADSHPIHGALVFTVGNATALPLPEAGAATDNDPALSAVFWAARWLGYGGLALLAGGVLFLLVCWPAGRSLAGPRRLLVAGWATSAAAAAAVLLLQGPYATGATLAAVADPDLLAATLSTEYGRYVAIRLGLLAIGGALVLGMLRVPNRARHLGIAAAVVLGLGLPATWIGTGHANAEANPLVALADTAHLAAMAAWAGGLAVLLTCLLPDRARRSTGEMAAALPRFSRLATVAVAVLVGTGTYQAWRGTGSIEALSGTRYGMLLVFKLAAVGVVLWLGSLSRSAVRRRYLLPIVQAATRTTTAAKTKRDQQAEQAARRQLRWTVRAESVTILAILAVTALLVATPPADRPAPADPPAPATTTAPTTAPSAAAPERTRIGAFEQRSSLPGGASVDVRLDPAEIGATTVTLTIRRADGSAWDVPEVTAALTLPAREIGPLPVTLARTGPGVYTSTGLSLPSPGLWQLVVKVRTTEVDQTTVELEVPIG